jgi:S-adenosylmethionine:tRNA ribosyltransferase-isomerase
MSALHVDAEVPAEAGAPPAHVVPAAPPPEPQTRFELPDELSATGPPEARGLARDEVRLLVADGRRPVRHARFRDLDRHLRPGDLLVVNTSATLAAAVDGTRFGTGRRILPTVVHVATALDDGRWVVELRSAPDGSRPVLDARPGERVRLPDGATLTLLEPHREPGAGTAAGPDAAGGDGVRLWRAATLADLAGVLRRHGRPIRYGYVDGEWPLSAYQTVFAREAGSAEMPSAGRPFTTELVTRLVTSGVLVAPVVLHTGVSSLESHEPPPAERFAVPAATAALVNWTRGRGGRVIAVGTTVTRALESAAADDGTVTAQAGWTDLVLGPHRPARVLDGLVTGLHAPGASHLLLLEAVVGARVVRQAYDAALERRYLWHEFGDTSLLLRPRRP